MNLRATNPRLECDPLAEQSLDYLAAHRQLDVPRFGLDRLPGLGHQVPGDRLAAVDSTAMLVDLGKGVGQGWSSLGQPL
jgi:hypothetical protein